MAKNWDKENMKSLSVNMKKETAVTFQEYAKEKGTTVGALLRGFVEATLAGKTKPSAESTELPDGVNGWSHTISFKLEDLLKAEVAHHNPKGLNPDEMLNRIVEDYFRVAKYLRK
jgi:hypothetical protein